MVERVKVYEKGVVPVDSEATTYGEYQFMIRDGDIFSPRVEVTEPLKNQCLHFLECVTEGTLPLTDGQAGMEVVQVMEAVDYSLQHNGAPVSLKTGQIDIQTLGNGNSTHETKTPFKHPANNSITN